MNQAAELKIEDKSVTSEIRKNTITNLKVEHKRRTNKQK